LYVYIPTSTAVASFKLDGLFSDVSMQITVKVELRATITLFP